MSDLITRLRAALDAEEAVVRRNNDGRGLDGGFPDYRTYVDDDTAAADAYIDRFNPTRMLADIAAKRAILDLHAEFDFPHDTDDGPGDYAWTARCDGCHEPVPCATVRLLAEAYGITEDGPAT